MIPSTGPARRAKTARLLRATKTCLQSTQKQSPVIGNRHFHLSCPGLQQSQHRTANSLLPPAVQGSLQPSERSSTTTTTAVAPTAPTSYQPPHEYIAALTAAWCFSPVNTGNPYLDESSSRIAVPPPPPPRAVPQATLDQLQALSSFWTTSPVNPGAISFNDLFFTVPEEDLNQPSATSSFPSTVLMASDDDYASFLKKASSDRQAKSDTSPTVSESKSQRQTVTTQSIPAPLSAVKLTYTSDADEPFEPVSLHRAHKYQGQKLTKSEVQELTNASGAGVEKLTVHEFDPRGQYSEVIDAIGRAQDSEDSHEITVWRVEASGARCEYWILSVTEKDDTVVGFKALAVES